MREIDIQSKIRKLIANRSSLIAFFRASRENGVTLILTMIILTNILMIALVVGIFSLGQQNIMTNARNSVYAIFAATSGLEKALYDIRFSNDCSSLSPGPLTGVLDNGSGYSVYASPCSQTNSSVTSQGSFRGVTRTIEANW